MLPAELLVRVLEHVALHDLPATLRALELACSAWRRSLRASDELWAALARRATLPALAARAGPPTSFARRSARVDRSARLEFARAYGALRARSEQLVHALASMAQDSRDLSVGKVRKLLTALSPCLLDRVSPVSNATALMEVCRARGCSEAAILAGASELVVARGASARAANSEGQSPLIIAAARGLPRLVALLLEHGADASDRGFGRFCTVRGVAPSTNGASQVVVRGTLSPLEWAETILARERDGGVAAKAQRSLRQCAALLRRAAVVGGAAAPAAGQAAPPAGEAALPAGETALPAAV